MDKVDSSGIMEKFLKENGNRERKMGLEFGDLLVAISIKDNGRIIGKTARDTMFIKEAQSIEGLLKNFWSTDREMKNLQMEIGISDSINSASLMALESIPGQMEIPTKEILYKDLEKGKEN